MIKRRKTKTVKIGAVKVGSGYPVSLQSMAKTDTKNISATVKQIKALEKCGCEIVRVAVRDVAAAQALAKIKDRINIPLVADIHFNYRLGLQALESGVDGIRLNPGNIYRREEVREVARAAKKRRIPIRVGVNAGSLKIENFKLKNEKSRPKHNLGDSMAKAALDYIKMLEGFDFYDIIVSLKASDVAATVSAYRKLAKYCDYPFHLGITASGLPEQGTVKSAIGIGALLLAGIGDTIRVSLSAPPQEEVRVAKEILQSLGLRNFGPQIIACPTCGRSQVDVIEIARKVQDKLNSLNIKHPTLNNHALKVAIMGCEVNGPGEASEADLGIAGGKNCAALFKKGKIVKKIKQNRIVNTLLTEIKDAME